MCKKFERAKKYLFSPSYENEYCQNTIKKLLKKNKKFKLIEKKNKKEIFNLLKNGKILGRFEGRMEMGQRSLGNRSIIADPRKLETIKLINNKIKMRDFWMPFTPTILKKYENKYLINQKKLSCPFMSMAFDPTKYFQKIAPATIHPADQTTRPQIWKEK